MSDPQHLVPTHLKFVIYSLNHRIETARPNSRDDRIEMTRAAPVHVQQREDAYFMRHPSHLKDALNVKVERKLIRIKEQKV